MSSKKTKADADNFGSATARLEEIVHCMESTQTSLEDMISLVEEGTKLTRHCRRILDEAELRIQKLEAPQPEPKKKSRKAAASDNALDDNHDFNLL